MDSEIRDGLRSAAPVVISVLPFGLLFGALAVDAGMSVSQAVMMSATVFAGASQMVGIELFGQAIAPWLIVFSVFAVNFRHVLYSAAAGRRFTRFSVWQKALAFFFLTDPQFAETEARGERDKPVTFRWYVALAVPIFVFWIAETWLGALFGRMIPDPHALGIDFLLPIYFLGLVMSFRKRPLWLPVVAASAVVSIIAWRFVGSPWHVSLGALAGIVLAMVAPLKGEAAEAGRAGE
ncbi:MAG: AzlC family ABC transporter permease [Salaquimonas sp.]|jgi:4-azaleucine resistance transporter AzlC|nr:AzlC family ABC transporter permease [Salaquimonas sp.]